MNANLTNEFQYQTGFSNIPLENLFDAEGILLGAVFLAPELIHEITLESCHFSQKRNQLLLLSREELDQVSSDNCELINVNIAKHRNGPVGVVKLAFERNYSRFRDYPVKPGL